MIDYKTQQSRLFPLLASAYAFRFVGEWLQWLYTDVTERLAANDFSTLPEAHACTAGLKSITTAATAVSIFLNFISLVIFLCIVPMLVSVSLLAALSVLNCLIYICNQAHLYF